MCGWWSFGLSLFRRGLGGFRRELNRGPSRYRWCVDLRKNDGLGSRMNCGGGVGDEVNGCACSVVEKEQVTYIVQSERMCRSAKLVE